MVEALGTPDVADPVSATSTPLSPRGTSGTGAFNRVAVVIILSVVPWWNQINVDYHQVMAMMTARQVADRLGVKLETVYT